MGYNSICAITVGIIIFSLLSPIISGESGRTEINSPITRSSQKTIVNGSGSGDYTHIQGAIDNASEGDTVFVQAGTYHENVLISKTITLVGQGSEDTIINGGGESDVIHIKANHVNVSGFNITNCGDDYERDMGIELNFSSYSKIENNVIFSNYFSGISLSSSDNITVANNTCHSNGIGIVVRWNSSDNIITNNTCYWNYERGISVHGARNRIDNNTCKSNGWSGIAVGSWGNTLADNNCSSSQNGISLDGAYGNNVIRNTCLLNNYGIELSGSGYNNISENRCFRNNNGIALGQVSNGNLITSNNVFNNVNWGLGINYYPYFCEVGCGGNLVYQNRFINNNNGSIQAVDNSSGNSWNHTSIGNYWSDLPMIDEDEDGIIDQVYAISGLSGIFDFFPLSADFDSSKPVAFGGMNKIITVNTLFQFNASNSYDDAPIAYYTWTFAYNETQITLYGSDPIFLFGESGNYTVSLRVEDKDGNTDSDLFDIKVNPVSNIPEPEGEPNPDDSDVKKKKSTFFVWIMILSITLFLTILGLLVFIMRKKDF